MLNDDWDRLVGILENGFSCADHDCTGYGCIDCDYSCGAGCWQEKVTPQERQDLLWEFLQQIIGEVRRRGDNYPGDWHEYEDSYSKLLEDFLWNYGKEIRLNPRCSGLVDDFMNRELLPCSENWGTLKMSELGEYADVDALWDSRELSPPKEYLAEGTGEHWVEWHRENVLQPSMEAVISFCLKVIDTLSLDVDREPSTALVFTRARRFLEICSDERERVRMAVLRKEAFVSAWDRGNRRWVVKAGVYRFVDNDLIRQVVYKLPPTAWSVDDYGTYEIK